MVKLITPHPGKYTRIGPFIAHDTSQNLEGSSLICDFGDARFAVQEHDDLITPVMQMKWNKNIDMQSLVMVAWQLRYPRTLFRGLDPETHEQHDAYDVAEWAL